MRMLLKVSLSLGLLVWLGTSVDWGTTIKVLQNVHPYVVVLAYLLSLAVQSLPALRMLLLLRTQSIRVGYSWVLRMNFVGIFASNFMPSTVGGDLLRMAMLANASESKTQAIVCVSADRAINAAGRLCFVPFVIQIWARLGYNFSLSEIGRSAGIVLVAGALLLSLLVLVLCGAWIRRATRDPSQSTSYWLQRKLTEVAAISSAFLSQPIEIAAAFVLTWIAILTSFIIKWTVACELDISLSLLEYIAVSLLINFASMLPISFNGLGLREAGTVFLLAQFGVSPEKSAALALLLRCMSIATTVPGAFWIPARGYRKTTA